MNPKFIQVLIFSVTLAGLLFCPSYALEAQDVEVYDQGTVALEDVSAFEFTPDGQRLIVASRTEVYLVDPSAREVVRSFRVSDEEVKGVSAGANGRLVFFFDDNGNLGVLDLIDGRVVGPMELSQDIRSVDAARDASRAVVGGSDGYVEVVNDQLNTELQYKSANLYGKDVTFVSFGLRDKEIIAITEDDRTAVWSVGNPDSYRQSSPERQNFRNAAVSSSGRFVAIAEEVVQLVRSVSGLHARANEVIRLYDWERGRDLRSIEGLAETIGPLAWGPEGRVVFSVLDDSRLAVTGVEDGYVEREIALGERVTALAASPSAGWLAAGVDGEGVRVFRVGSSPPSVAQGTRPVHSSNVLSREKFEFTTPREAMIRSAERMKIAVLDLAARGVNRNVTGSVEDFLSSQLANRNNLTTIERGAIQQVLEEVKFENSGLTSAEDAAEIGRLLNADVVLLGSVSRLGGSIVVSIRVVRTQSARILGARELVCNDCRLEDLPSLTSLLATALAED